MFCVWLNIEIIAPGIKSFVLPFIISISDKDTNPTVSSSVGGGWWAKLPTMDREFEFWRD